MVSLCFVLFWFLSFRSIEVKSADHNAWRQYYTLGEIFKAYGHFQESILHLRHALDLHPDYEPIEMALRDAEEQPSSSMHIYTFIIIVCLVCIKTCRIFNFKSMHWSKCPTFQVVGVLLVILSTSETTAYSQEALEPKSQRHFNRAMAMRSLKGLTPRSTKYKKYYWIKFHDIFFLIVAKEAKLWKWNILSDLCEVPLTVNFIDFFVFF